MTKNNNINVANNVAQRNSQDLTEQWKKGKLSFGRYYIKDINDEIFADSYTNNGFINGFEDFFDSEISEVLAPVPSYGDCLINEALIKDLSKKVNKLIEENNKLKELIKECSLLLRKQTSNDEVDFKESVMLVSKIEEVLE